MKAINLFGKAIAFCNRQIGSPNIDPFGVQSYQRCISALTDLILTTSGQQDMTIPILAMSCRASRKKFNYLQRAAWDEVENYMVNELKKEMRY